MRSIDLKNLYNTFLRISRTKQNKPFKYKKNWEGFEESEDFIKLNKIKNILERNSIVNIEDFFSSPYAVYEEKTYYDLDFYCTLNAIKVYSIFCSKRSQMSPDDAEQINLILRGLKFIQDFCNNSKIEVAKYLEHKERGNITNSFILHLKEKNISIYNLFAFNNFEKVLFSHDQEVCKFILNETFTRIPYYRAQFLNSKKAKNLSITGLNVIQDKVKKTLCTH